MQPKSIQRRCRLEWSCILLATTLSKNALASIPSPLASYSFNSKSLNSKRGDNVASNYSASWGSGRDGSDCLSFDGRGGYVELPSAVTLTGDSPRTYCLWTNVVPSNFSSGTLFYSGSINTGPAGQCSEFTLRTSSAPASLSVTLSSNGHCDDVVVVSSTIDGGWHHFCLSYDGTQWDLFHDTSLQASGVVSLATGSNFSLRLGNSPTRDGGNQYVLTGEIDEVYLFDIALSQSEVESLYWLYAPMAKSLPPSLPSRLRSHAPSTRPRTVHTKLPTTYALAFVIDD